MYFLEFEFSDGGPFSLITSILHVYVTLTLDCCFLTMAHFIIYLAEAGFFFFPYWNLFFSLLMME